MSLDETIFEPIGETWPTVRSLGTTGGIAAGWTDASTIHGAGTFDPLTVVNGEIVLYPQLTSHDAWSPGPWDDGASSPWLMAHGMATFDCGLSDNFEVTVGWRCVPGEGASTWNQVSPSTWNQVSPVVFADINAADPLEMGVVPIWDFVAQRDGVLGSTYLQNAFRAPLADTFDPPAYYRPVSESLFSWGYQHGEMQARQHWWTIRCVAGKVAAWFDGERQFAPVNLSSATTTNDPGFTWEWAAGRTQIGVHIIHFCIDPGRLFPGTAIVASERWPSRLNHFSWRPYTEPLV